MHTLWKIECCSTRCQTVTDISCSLCTDSCCATANGIRLTACYSSVGLCTFWFWLWRRQELKIPPLLDSWEHFRSLKRNCNCQKKLGGGGSFCRLLITNRVTWEFDRRTFSFLGSQSESCAELNSGSAQKSQFNSSPFHCSCDSISLFLPISSSLFNPSAFNPVTLSRFIPLFPLPFTHPPPSVVTKLKEGTESKVCGVPPRLSRAGLLRIRHSTGRQAIRHTAAPVCHILSLIFLQL